MQSIELDVSDLPAPEPFQQIVATLTNMGSSYFLRVHHRRQPKMLYQTLLDMGFEFHVQSGKQQAWEIIIWHGYNEQPIKFDGPDLSRLELN